MSGQARIAKSRIRLRVILRGPDLGCRYRGLVVRRRRMSHVPVLREEAARSWKSARSTEPAPRHQRTGPPPRAAPAHATFFAAGQPNPGSDNLNLDLARSLAT